MAILNVGTLGPYFDLQSALDAAQPGDTIIINTLNPGGGDYAHGSVWDEGITITTAVDVGTVQFGLTGGIFDVTATGPSDFIIFGNANNNILTAGDGDDLLFGAAGNDTLNGGAGADIASYIYDPAGVSINLATGMGADGFGGTDTLNSIEAIAGSQFGDTLIGDTNDNYFLGLGGNDTINGGDGIDTLSYEDVGLGGGAVTVNLATGVATDGLGGTDTISGIEYVIGSSFGDTLIGDGNDNQFLPEGGNDNVIGGDGVDFVSYETSTQGVGVNLGSHVAWSDGFGGRDTLNGIEGVVGTKFSDTIAGDRLDNFIAPNGGSNFLSGGDGFDTVIYATSTSGVSVDFENETASDGMGGVDSVRGFEAAVGSSFADNFMGSANDEDFTGGGGDDVIDGGDGTDTAVFLRAANHYTVVFNSSSNTYEVAANNGSEGVDTLTSIEYLRFFDETIPIEVATFGVIGSSGDDVLLGDESDNSFLPGAGNDLIDGQGGIDTVSYASSTSGVEVNLETGSANDGMNGVDLLSNIEGVIGSEFDDILVGSSSDEIFVPGAGINTVEGGGGRDTLSFVDADEPVILNAGGSLYVSSDERTTHSGIEVFLGSNAGNTFYDADGAHEYVGGDGYDVLRYGNTNSAITVDFVAGQVVDGSGVVDRFSNIERVFGTVRGDRFEMNSPSAVIYGSGGDDTVSFASFTGGVFVNLEGADSADQFGNSISLYQVEILEGTQFDDRLVGSGGMRTEHLGMAGNDTIEHGAGLRQVWASYRLDPSSIQVDLAANRVVDGFGSIDTLVDVVSVRGSNFDDVFQGDDRNNHFEGLGGHDVLIGGGGVDVAYYNGNSFEYEVLYYEAQDRYTVRSLIGDEGVDSLKGIERIAFNGSAFDIDTFAKNAPPMTSDFDGDGDDDIVYSLTASGNSVFNNADGTGGGWIGYADRTVIGTGDFNGDGDADLLFRFTDGNHSGFDSGGAGPWLGRSDRTAVAVGDFNGDGDDDVLFQFANGNKHIADADSGNTWVGFADRSIEAVGDFDGDGDDDVLFELNAGGYVTNNVDGTGGRWLGGPNRDVAGIGDFDGDGDDDILFVLNSGGHIINDGEGGGMQWFGFTDRSVAGIGDFDGDGNDDILFHLSDGNHTIISPNGVGRWIARTNNTVRDVGDYDGDGDDDILFEAPGGGFVVDQADGGAGLGMYFLDRTLVAGDPLGIGLTSDADLV
ncbi:MAG: calcium-binding protein [Alphaproteobacteria bacterium]|nr:calcium-binding protein [Alphaproteobacteria bacterium]